MSVIQRACLIITPTFTQVWVLISTSPSDICFDELKDKVATKEVTVIDVRMPKELREDGMIPDSKNLARESCSCLMPLLTDEECSMTFLHFFTVFTENICHACPTVCVLCLSYSDFHHYFHILADQN